MIATTNVSLKQVMLRLKKIQGAEDIHTLIVDENKFHILPGVSTYAKVQV